MSTYKTPLNGPVNAVCYGARSCQYSAVVARAREAERYVQELEALVSRLKTQGDEQSKARVAAEADVARLKKRVAFLTDGRE